MLLERLAPAKVNLYLHVGPPGPDGYHPLDSLMVFADIGDRLSILTGGEGGLAITGPFADGLPTGPDNLIIRASELLARGRSLTFRLGLDKRLPIASGLGGGSADAAATLRLLNEAFELDLPEATLSAIGLELGSDVPACLNGRPAIATGRGERLQPAPRFPDLAAVLVNPGAPSPTGEVYREYDKAVSASGANAPLWPARFESAVAMAEFLRTCRNDLQAPAMALQPAIGQVLRLLAQQPEALLTRMSGSGATCFALCSTPEGAAALAARVAAAQPSWWVAACLLGGSAG